ncbi:membrane protein insertase YidC [Bradyrhizobium sp. U87765 SZCCT0131]|uniref:membrane protein insertase YidC n=1 Tax=unclassified Bradyrhizobium TaxID=2631580 RepID=UPI001BAE0485|nr:MULTISPECIES: membrane protein insertase YidC [unclassified Bradyrhizobium]MBR1217416.1 membrane protein insertase YidC [Bradyrhizobium sp. U87765 SZCCT0131]MBR1264987.1 membrane protein insertase YidC [Bradyrhizobium sp. U87765 SZCCT0134]MBR1304969.1 membrane protein insertase YidC [Bradyrhizobium sp. U87765 SZCCT0110]MBR1320755.1 membrane protein insertase YidC [Bradyrhizobium sp. U87765 SZCCT0109]MBR1349175.1 membrane protein insertase YidC [Bradyrhizobium sp. U87765 SZCCT0048]
MTDNRNTILAVVLSGIVLLGWQYFFNIPQMEKQRAAEKAAQQQAQIHNPNQPAAAGQATPAPGGPATAPGVGPAAAPTMTRDAALAAAPRVKIDTPRVSGSISLKGGRIDDVSLLKYRETVDPNSPAIVLFEPSGAPNPYYAEFGWVGASGTTAKLPDQSTLWTQNGSNALTPTTPVVLTWNNGEGLTFKRTISIDENYLFSLKDDVSNAGSAPVTLYPYALISRHGMPQVAGYYILHEGLIGVMGDQGLQEFNYKKIDEEKKKEFKATNAWLGITDKYWAATLLPDAAANVQARFSSNVTGNVKTYQTDYLLDPVTVAVGGNGSANARLFAGAKEAGLVGINSIFAPGLGGYNKQLGLNHFDLLIDWGWFYFITKPMFLAIDFLFHLVGNFGVAILLVTVLVKAIFFPLANKSYASMAKMKAVQPKLAELRERFPDDKMKQQQEMMELYKKEKINPLAGCLPIAIQIPVFFSLYKVLFVTIEMRHAPFFGWIKDLSAPDPTNLFTLFGLLNYDPTQLPIIGHYLALGIWPIIMGITMWFQMKLNPTPPDPTQKMIFDWMPLIFTFMLGSFPAGLVIYWAWNNTLSVLQQSAIMSRNGAKIELFDNIKATFVGSKKTADSEPKTQAKG